MQGHSECRAPATSDCLVLEGEEVLQDANLGVIVSPRVRAVLTAHPISELLSFIHCYLGPNLALDVVPCVLVSVGWFHVGSLPVGVAPGQETGAADLSLRKNYFEQSGKGCD